MLETILNIKEIADFLDKAMEHQPRLYSHSIYTAMYAENIAEELGLNRQALYTVMVGAILHDIGKLYIPDYTLNKPKTLSKSEWDLMHVHPLTGLGDVPTWVSPDIMDIIRHHHEKLDGSGYPDGITNIAPLTRLVTVADIFEALTGKRAYRDKSSKIEALKILKEEVAKGKIDGTYVDALERHILNNKSNKEFEKSVEKRHSNVNITVIPGGVVGQ